MASNGIDTAGLDAETTELVESLNTLTQDIITNAKGYKDATGQQGLLKRLRMANAARKINDTIREPGETPYELSTHVCNRAAGARRRAWSIDYRD